MKGKKQAGAKMRGLGMEIPQKNPPQFLSIPTNQEKLETLFTRTFSELKGINQEMSRQIGRELAGGLADGIGPRQMASRINDRVDKIGITRARMMARTEVVNAHNEAALDRYERNGIKQVSGQAEDVQWQTAEDMRVCPRCEGLNGESFDIEDAHGLVPLHPRCILSGQTSIQTLQGEKNIRKIENGDKVLTHKGNYKKVASVQKEKGYEGKYYQIKAHKDHRVSVTPDHPLMTQNGWKKANELDESDKIAVKGKFCEKCGEICEVWRDTCSKSCSAKKQWNNDDIRNEMQDSISEASKKMWQKKGDNDEWKSKVLDPAHEKTQKMVDKGNHIFQKLWKEKYEKMKKQSQTVAANAYKSRENNWMENRTGKDHPNWKGGKNEYYRMRANSKGNWHKNRKKALERDKYKCRNCQIGKDHAIMDVHHIKPVRDGGNNELDNLVTLCRSCHMEVEKSKEKIIDKKMGIISGGSQKEKNPIAFTDIYKIKQKKTDQPLVRWNLSVNEDESYVAGRIVVHNCRCTWLPIVNGQT